MGVKQELMSAERESWVTGRLSPADLELFKQIAPSLEAIHMKNGVTNYKFKHNAQEILVGRSTGDGADKYFIEIDGKRSTFSEFGEDATAFKKAKEVYYKLLHFLNKIENNEHIEKSVDDLIEKRPDLYKERVDAEAKAVAEKIMDSFLG